MDCEKHHPVVLEGGCEGHPFAPARPGPIRVPCLPVRIPFSSDAVRFDGSSCAIEETVSWAPVAEEDFVLVGVEVAREIERYEDVVVDGGTATICIASAKDRTVTDWHEKSVSRCGITRDKCEGFMIDCFRRFASVSL